MPIKHVRRQIFVALALIINKNDEVLLAQRHDPKNHGMHGKWEFPGGKVEFGEHPEDTVVREAAEEVDLQISVQNILKNYSWFHPDRPHIQVILMTYIARADNPDAARANCREVKDVVWKSIDAALDMDVIDNNKIILRDLRQALKKNL